MNTWGDGAEPNSPALALDESTGTLTIEDSMASAIVPGPCEPGDLDYIVICDIPTGGVRFDLGDGRDHLVVPDGLGALPITVSLLDTGRIDELMAATPPPPSPTHCCNSRNPAPQRPCPVGRSHEAHQPSRGAEPQTASEH